ncbi:MAG: hypothetical protein J7L55_04515 [Desulfurococcales archaeon]|nr:hypothetical protein [Desulfurococcales archaeon]
MGNGSQVKPEQLERAFSKESVRQEFSSEERIRITEGIRESLIEFGMLTPLLGARRL